MKKKVLRALLVICALNVNAQSDKFKDTLVISANAETKVLFIGNDMKEMVTYLRADSVKDSFLSDLEKAKQQQSFPAESHMVHYIVHSNGKRRLKAENEDYQEPALDVTKEIRSMGLNLPPYAYIIHDTKKNYEIQIYLSNPNDIIKLRDVNLTKAIQTISKSKKDQRKFSRIDIASEDGLWKKKSTMNREVKSFELGTQIGAGFIGNMPTPDLGFQIHYVMSDKYSAPLVKLGFAWRMNMLSSYTNGEFNNIYRIDSYNIDLFANVSQDRISPIRWVGIEIGYLNASGGVLDKNYKASIVYAFNAVQVSFDIYNSKLSLGKSMNNPTVYGFTVRVGL